ncbi:MAG TPA: IclR family transcriptional regulator [Tepidisphaeraceae bacterium]|nr:IclR family transcriptional regulator [Tepidisphaeraceae bacterium]
MGQVKDKATEADSRYKVPNLERGLRIMELLMDRPQGLSQSELVSRLGYSKTSVFRITMTLVEYGYLVRDEETKSLALSRKLLAMGTKALCETDLMASAIDVLRNLRDLIKETMLIGTIAGNEVIVLDQVLGAYPFKFSVDRGARLPIHTSAPAKAMLAFMPERECESIIQRIEFVRFNDRTITTAELFREELNTVREVGYALDHGEQLGGIHCVAAPVFDRHGYPIAGVWTTGPADRIPTSALPTIGKQIVSHVKVISARLGYGLLDSALSA